MIYLLLIFVLGLMTPVQTAANSRLRQAVGSPLVASLATFKRNFASISDLPPQKWLIQQRLEAARKMICDERRQVSDVYMEVDFKNRSHFTVAFKKQYGFAPGMDK